MVDEVYLTPKQTAAYLNISTSTLAKRRLYGGSPRYVKIGRAVRYRKSDLDDFMASNIQRSTFEGAEL
jgi:excisionase family DNA binding protein